MTTKQNQFIEVYSQDKSISATCKHLRITRSTFYRWKISNEDFRQRVEDIRDAQIDLVEDMLMQKIKEGDTTSIIFYLKTQGKNRGYNEKIELEDSKNIIVVVE